MFRDFTVSGIARGNQEGIGIILTAPLHTYKNTPDFSIMEIIEKTPTLKVILEMYSECDQKSVNWRLIPHTITYTLLIGNDKIKVQAENMAA